MRVEEGDDAPGHPAGGKGGPGEKGAVRGSTVVGSGSSTSQHPSRTAVTPVVPPSQPHMGPSMTPHHQDPSSTLVNFDHASHSSLPAAHRSGRPRSSRRRRESIPDLPQTLLVASGSKRESSETRGLSESQLFRFFVASSPCSLISSWVSVITDPWPK